MAVKEISGNLWKPSGLKPDGASKLGNQWGNPQSFAAIPPETPAEAEFLRKHGPLNSQSWQQSFPHKPHLQAPGPVPQKLPSNPLSAMVPSDYPGHPVLSNGKPNQAFYSNQSTHLKNELTSASQSMARRHKPFTPDELGQLKRINPLAHDRYAALSPKQKQGISSFGPMNELTMLIPKSAGGKSAAASSRFMPGVDPSRFEEIYSARHPSTGNPKAIGTRQAGDNWYMFGTEVGEGIQNPDFADKGTFGRGDEAATWFAPESYAEGDLPGGNPGPGMDNKNVIDDVQGIMEGPWRDYLQGPSMGDGEHGVQAVHASPDGNDFQTFMGQFDKAKGILSSLQSAAKSIQSLAKLAGLAESLGQFGSLLGSIGKFSIPSSPGAMVTSLLKGSGCLGPPALKKDVAATTAIGVDGIVVTTGGAGAEAVGKALAAAIGKNTSGSGSQKQGEGSEKSVSKKATGGDVEREYEIPEGKPADKNAPEISQGEGSDKSRSDETAGGDVDAADGPEEKATGLDDLLNSEGELAPDNLRSRLEREAAYATWEERLSEAGGEAAKVKFPQMAKDVTDDLGGLIANRNYSESTQDFLEAGNDELYRFNDKMFNKLEQTPEELFDPAQFVQGAEADQLGRVPKNPLEFDLQMVKAEQAQLEGVINSSMPADALERQKVLDEINVSLSLNTNILPDYVEYIGGKIAGYEVESVDQASTFLGRKIDFSNQEDRRAIGYAAAFRSHGYNESTYREYMKNGTVPNTRPNNSFRDMFRHPTLPPGSPLPGQS